MQKKKKKKIFGFVPDAFNSFINETKFSSNVSVSKPQIFSALDIGDAQARQLQVKLSIQQPSTVN
jgi:hypothetical protein